MKYIVIDKKGRPMRFSTSNYGVRVLVAVGVDIQEATRFDSTEEAEKRADKAMNLAAGYRAVPLKPLDQQ